jgi:hypothetical protein
MTDDDAAGTGTAPDDDGPSGAFVARIWHDPEGLRARVRHTADVRERCADDEVALLRGPRDRVIGDLVDRFHHWAVRCAGARDDAPGRAARPDDGALTRE